MLLISFKQFAQFFLTISSLSFNKYKILGNTSFSIINSVNSSLCLAILDIQLHVYLFIYMSLLSRNFIKLDKQLLSTIFFAISIECFRKF